MDAPMEFILKQKAFLAWRASFLLTGNQREPFDHECWHAGIVFEKNRAIEGMKEHDIAIHTRGMANGKALEYKRLTELDEKERCKECFEAGYKKAMRERFVSLVMGNGSLVQSEEREPPKLKTEDRNLDGLPSDEEIIRAVEKMPVVSFVKWLRARVNE